MLFKNEEDREFFQGIFSTLERNAFLDFDESELINLIEKRHLYLESISKLYNELAMINKVKQKEKETLLNELEAAENNRFDTESHQQKIFKKGNVSQLRKLTYFELKHKHEQLQIDIAIIREKINKNRLFIRFMEANTIELMRKVTFKIKVLDQMSVQLIDGFTPFVEGMPVTPPNDEFEAPPNEYSVKPQTKEIIIDLLQNKKITVPEPLQQIQNLDVIILGNQDLLDMVNIFEDNYWLVPEKVEERYKRRKTIAGQKLPVQKASHNEQ